MPPKSERQRRAAAMALAAKRKKIPASKLKGAAKQMMKMSEEDLRKYAKKPRRKS